LIAFVGDLPVPKTVNVPLTSMPRAEKLIIDVALIALFGLQHSVMARPAFKRAWTRTVPPVIERSVYVLCASLALIILFRFWQPFDRVIWQVSPNMQWLSTILWVMFWLGWATVLISTFLINHFELFGLQQAWFNMTGRQAAAPELRQPLFYRWVAHPLYAGFFLAFWSTPLMTAGHLLLAAGLSVYILIAIRYEERDLTDLFGDDYRRYRARVGGLVPRFWR
jgi:methanethiol S-methyltransferase